MGKNASAGLVISAAVLALLSVVVLPLADAWALVWLTTTYGLPGLTFAQWVGLGFVVRLLWKASDSSSLEADSVGDNVPKIVGHLAARMVYPPPAVLFGWVWAHALGVL